MQWNMQKFTWRADSRNTVRADSQPGKMNRPARPDSQPDDSQRRRQPAPTASAELTDGPKVRPPRQRVPRSGSRGAESCQAPRRCGNGSVISFPTPIHRNPGIKNFFSLYRAIAKERRGYRRVPRVPAMVFLLADRKVRVNPRRGRPRWFTPWPHGMTVSSKSTSLYA